MSTYPDAIGYIRKLGHSEGIPWLEMICDLAASGKTALSSIEVDTLTQLFKGQASYLRQPAPKNTIFSAGAPPSTMVERLETIGPFNGFKRLGASLATSFPKRVTIVFGANGSGKSSICEALQILASNDAPRRPLHDVRKKTATPPSFAFKFATDATVQHWTSPGTYGSRSGVLKYFDLGIAAHCVKNAVQPGRIIELSPFKLDVFATAKKHCEDLRAELQRMQTENISLLTGNIEKIRAKFSSFEGTALAMLTIQSISTLKSQIELGEAYNEDCGLIAKLKTRKDLENATSEEGLKLLKGEVAALKALHGEIQPILNASEKIIEIDPATQSTILIKKEEELEVLAKALIPTGGSLEKLMNLIRPANDLCDLNSPERGVCPLCKQALRENEIELFKQYSSLLTEKMDSTIVELRRVVNLAEDKMKVISDTVPDDWAKDSVLPLEKIVTIKKAGKAIQKIFKEGVEINQEATEAVATLRNLNKEVLESEEKLKELIEKAGKDHEQLLTMLSQISSECQSLIYSKEIAENINLVKDAYQQARNAAYWDSNLPTFTTVLRKITSTAKTAHKELVVEDFKTRLNAEYLALAETEMSVFGVELKDVGGDGAVTVEHHVAGQKIDTVLSEGEQRIHALALFFAELETCKQRVIIFDDPVSSFDYNYISNYCNRLRNFLHAHPDRQIIVLTHNWEFFVQFQTTLNKARLSNQMAVHVLESCVAIDEYSENVDELEKDIEAILLVAGEPTKEQKEVMGGKMRRLIEAVVNTHVFNRQRHQFKQKSQQISAFDDFTKVVPLLPSEAQTLRDLFEKLSITEHDDPRNAYVNTTKAMFQTRYNMIKGIESSIVGRK
jgi:hypothetical protein